MSRILIVEDDAAIGVALEDDLRLEGYGVELVTDGEAALRRARDGGFDLVLLDVMLPKKDGFDVCRELRRSGVSSKILLLTARAGEIEKVLGLDFGADDYVTKPYSPKELRARIRALLRRGHRNRNPRPARDSATASSTFFAASCAAAGGPCLPPLWNSSSSACLHAARGTF